ncbi:unnamed protein product [Bemisia tabaci]|uniref:Uncharacterized protein n=1 Tax=Bemisia tabaci TaxID=7038 RepID=A0A9P0ADE0_BEMTA|nr:unnamed protein product [Bemisia tabaci]
MTGSSCLNYVHFHVFREKTQDAPRTMIDSEEDSFKPEKEEPLVFFDCGASEISLIVSQIVASDTDRECKQSDKNASRILFVAASQRSDS